ncbi:hypothetical protein ABPG72_008179, partial [Tetrahymena utriculariae]
SDSYSVGLLLSFIDNYLILKDQQHQFAVLTRNQQSFQNLQINIKKNTEIFKFMQPLVVWDRQKRVSISEIKYGNSKYFVQNSQEFKQTIYKFPLKLVQDLQEIKIYSMSKLHQIKEYQIVEIFF